MCVCCACVRECVDADVVLVLTAYTSYHSQPRLQADDLALNLGINVGLAISFLVGSFALFPINERNQHAKHIQLVSGLDVRTYWLTAFVWDYCTSIIPFVLFLIM